MRLLSIPFLLGLLVACQTPFGSDRHDLEGFRIAAMRTHQANGELTASVALVVDGRLWSDDQIALRWFRLDSDKRAVAIDQDPTDPPLAEGPLPTFPWTEPGRLLLIASAPGGEELRSVIDVAAPIDTAFTLAITPGTVAEPEDELTLTASVRETEHLPLMRWMSLGGGTFAEQTEVETTWTAAEQTFDDEELIESLPLSAGPVTVLALAVDEQGGNAFQAAEIWVGEPPQGVWTTGGRFLETDNDVSGPWVAGVLVADDEAPTGLRLENARNQTEPLNALDPYGTFGLGCSGAGGPFNPDWLLEQRCLRRAIVGATVVVEVQ